MIKDILGFIRDNMALK